MDRIIAHLDMDAFFASVEERDNPRFKGRPIVVGADPEGGKGRGVVSTANYAARKYGIKSALPISTAWRYSEEAKKKGLPPAVFLSPGMEKYGAESEKIMQIVRENAQLVEEASIDEAYIDLSFTKTFEKARIICEKIKKEIKVKEKLTASIGLGPNKLIAKIASDMQKPDGLTVVLQKEAEAFLEPLGIRKIPGIGPKTEITLNKLGVRTVVELKKLSLSKLEELLGKWGGDLYGKARGLDDSPVSNEYEAKSIGEQETFHEDRRDANFIVAELKGLAESVIQRLGESDFETYRTLGITVRFSDFETKTRAHTLSEPASDAKTLEFEAIKLLLPFLDKRENPNKKAIRLIGVKIEKLE
ncbi:MAG: DNA polymerase IV [Candidatus Liptonbacteria bacterium]|nr:DNA polymerase IV [Candidatus Liptonbacteria bacterium]